MFDIAGDAKRSVAAILLFAVALLILLGFFGQAGVVGESLAKAVGIVVGWAKFVAPLFLILAGIILLLRKETSFYVSKLFGLAVALLSLTGLFHWFFELEKMAKVAKAGSGGGYLGFAVAYSAVKYLGNAGGLVIIVALFLIGAIVAFNLSIIHFINKWRERLARRAEEKTEEVSEENVAVAEMEKPIEIEAAPDAEEFSQDDNIGKIEFVEGPDRFGNRDEAGEKKVERKQFTRKKEKNQSEVDWQFPPLDLLESKYEKGKGGDTEANVQIIEKTLKYFGIDVERGEIKVGPSVTQYSFRPAVGVKISRILALQNDLALALAKHPIRIEAPIPGKSLIGIEIPNASPATVGLRAVLESKDFAEKKSNLTLALGEDVSGCYVLGNLDKMPHLMIAGATGTGKSVGVNAIITALLYQNSPSDLKFIMVDPKRVELSLYNGIPHLITDEVIVDTGKVVGALRWAVGEMERRYRLLQDASCRDLVSYNQAIKAGHKRKCTDPETGEITEETLEKLPYIVIIIDEMADLMAAHGKEVEGAIVRLAQMARAIGIHLIVSTQRPSVETITGLIKANITTRIAFQVASQIDSRTIIDMAGAEKLLGRGDMLYLSSASPKPVRLQGILVTEAEVKRVVEFVKKQKPKEESIGEDITANSPKEQKALPNFSSTPTDFNDVDAGGDEDDMYEAAKEEVIRAGKASATLLQRRLRIGYARAARILDMLEDKGVVGPAEGAKPRDVFVAAGDPAYTNPQEDQEKRDKWEM